MGKAFPAGGEAYADDGTPLACERPLHGFKYPQTLSYMVFLGGGGKASESGVGSCLHW